MTAPRSLTRRLLRRTGVESVGDLVFQGFTGFVATLILGLFLALLLILAYHAMPAWDAFGPGFIWSRAWDPPNQVFGALPYIVGTVASSVLALLFAVPVALGTAVALTELLDRRIAAPLGILVELLAAVPSIVYGIWGFAVIVPVVKGLANDHPWLVKTLGGGPTVFGPSLLAAGLILAIMMLPIITAVTRDMLRAVPREQREAALALGLTRWEVTWRVTLPHARGGTIAAIILGFGRAIGETMAVIFVIGNQPLLPEGLFAPGATIATVIANEFGDPSGDLHFPSLIELGLILLIMSVIINLLARFIVRRYRRRLGGAV